MKFNNVLGLFDGISCLQVALNRAGFQYDNYCASEIDKYAIKVTQSNYPETIQLGSVTDWKSWDIDWGKIDLIGAGFPCQAWSIAGKQLGDKDERGKLFWTMLDIIKHAQSFNPNVKFIIENVKMKKEFEEYITHHTQESLGTIHKILIKSALVSAQNRNRYYWTNFQVSQPEDKGIFLKDILEDGFSDRDKSHYLDANYFKGGNLKSYFDKGRRQLVFKEKSQTILSTIYKENAKSMIKRGKSGLIVAGLADIKALESTQIVYSVEGKAPAVTTCGGGHREPKIIVDELRWRKLTPLECERLQTLPDGYTQAVSNTQRYKSIGNGWTVDVIVHILKEIK